MRINRSWYGCLAVLAVICSLTPGIFSQEAFIRIFNNVNGNSPVGGLIADAKGSLYGTTFYGGADTEGTVFKLTPTANGWAETILYSFYNLGFDGYNPNTRLVFDSAGNLYGTTFLGGAWGIGTVFQLSRGSDGTWTEKTIHSFDPNGGTDGTYPHSGLIFDAAGNLYGTTNGGGTFGNGVVYELSPGGTGGWTETVIHSFGGRDGAQPGGSLIMDTAGNLYGVTYFGGDSNSCFGGCGTVYELSPAAGNWTAQVLHSFSYANGANPFGALVFDAQGNLYGAANQGSAGNAGLIFELTPGANGQWNQQILHRFSLPGGDAMAPMGPLVFDPAGNLYGVSELGGLNGHGTVFELTPSTNGGANKIWSDKILYNFTPSAGNGFSPSAGLVIDRAGNLFGTTVSGGSMDESACFGGCGTVYEITP